MASGTVRFRQAAERLDYLRDRGFEPNKFAKEAFEKYVARLQAYRSSGSPRRGQLPDSLMRLLEKAKLRP